MNQAVVSRMQVLSQDLVSELELRKRQVIEWDYLTDTYKIPKDSAIWTWLTLKGIKDDNQNT